MGAKARLLVVDDEEFVRESLVAILEDEGWECVAAEGAPSALERLASERVDAVLTDLSMPTGDGIELIQGARERGFDCPIVVLTGVGKIADAVEAMRQGAYDFVQKPIDPEALVLLLRRALEHRELTSEVAQLRSAVQRLRGPAEMVGASPWFREARETIAKVGPSEAIVLVTGESGTGKELVALEVHRASRRSRGPLVQVNCAAISENLFESEFFGHRKGAFTGADQDRTGRFAEADRGTLVLDEIGTLRPEMQAKLLRVLETGEFQVVGESRTRSADARVVAITNEDLEARVEEGAFRSDLYYRLNIFPIPVPPLRERREDISVLANYFWLRFRADRDDSRALPDECLDVLTSYAWPGNIRELRNVVERATILTGDDAPDPDFFRTLIESAASRSGGEAALEGDLVLRPQLDRLEADLIRRALERAGGVKKKASELLGIDPKNLGYYLRKHEVGGEGDGAK